MLKVGLTGGIACGKTVVRRMLEKRGAFTVDADAIVHELFRADSKLAREVERAFGADVLAADGFVDRGRLGKVVFGDPEARNRLNALVHPRVVRAEKRLLAEAERIDAPLAVVDAALMIEVGTYRTYDFLIVVYCPPRLQMERLIERDALSEEEARRRIDAQMPVDQKKRYADYVIDSSGTLQDTKGQVDELWEILQRRARRRR